MDPVKILKRAWQILWSYRALWVFGLILALAGTSSQGNHGPSNNVQYETDRQGMQQPLPEDMKEAFRQAAQQMEQLLREGLTEAGIPQEQLTTLIWIGAAFVVFLMAIGIVVAIARYVAETAVIRMVDEYESTGTKMTVREGFRVGWSRTSWRLFLINLLVNLPLILVAILIAIGVAILFTMMQDIERVSVIALFGSAATVFVVIFATVIFSILLHLLRNFFWRVCALENATVGESLRRGFQMARDNWKSVGLMWLVMIGLAIAWAIASVILVILTIPLLVITGAAGAIVAAIPALLVSGLTSLFLDGWLTWLVGIVFALPLFLMIAFSPWLLLGSWETVFTSTVWTLVYRELKALPALTNGNVPVESQTS